MAKLTPDRWRTIASWLGISMNALLVAEQLIDQQESVEATQAAAAAGMTNAQWDAKSAESEGDYFSQERGTIADSARLGSISVAQAASLNRILFLGCREPL